GSRRPAPHPRAAQRSGVRCGAGPPSRRKRARVQRSWLYPSSYPCRTPRGSRAGRPGAPYISVPMDLAGSLAVVTGATEGIGRATAFALGRAGARVAICARTEANVRATARDLKTDGIDAIGMPCDVAICPGSVATPFMDKRDRPRPARDRALTAEEVAHAVLSTLTVSDRAMISEVDIRPTNP